jgi:phage terminase small subunit
MLTAKQRKFINFYEGNATQAAIKAGYSKKTAYRTGADNLRKPQIKEALKNREEKEAGPLIANRQERQRFWTAVVRNKLPKVKVKIYDRLKASELLGKSEADFTERVIHDVSENLAKKLEAATKREIECRKQKNSPKNK